MVRISALILFLFFNAINAQVNFIAITNTRQSLAGSPFTVEFRLENANGSNFTPPNFGGLRNLGGPSHSQSTTIINGAMSSSIGYVYTLVGMNPGKYTIGPAKITVGNKILQSNPITIEIVKNINSNKYQAPSEQEISGDIFVQLTADHSTVYVGQQIILTYKLYTQVNIENIEYVKNNTPERCEVEPLSTDYPAEREVYKGKQYTTKIISKLAIFPLQTGDLVIDPNQYKVLLAEDDPFGFPMRSMFFGQAKVVESNNLRLTILPLPKPLPDSFSGAVGQFKIQFIKPQPTYNISDVISLGILIEGNGNFGHFEPRIYFTDSMFESHKTNLNAAVKISETPQIVRSQTFEFLISPKREGQFYLYPSFSYFDAEQKKYILLSDTIPIQINRSVSMAQEENTKIMDIIPHLDHSFSKSLNRSWLFWIIIMLPWVGILILIPNRFKDYFTIKIGSFSKTQNSIKNVNDSDLEDLIMEKIKILFPESKNFNNLYQIKEFLTSKSQSNKAMELLDIIKEYQISKFNPAHYSASNETIRKRIVNIDSF